MTLRKAVEAAILILVDAYGGLFPRGEAMRKLYLYENAVKDYAVECYEPAAMECTRSMKFPPTPYEFAEVVRRLHREKFPDSPQTFARPGNPEALGEAMRLQRIQKAIDKRTAYVIKWCCGKDATMTQQRLAVSNVWGLMLQQCETAEEMRAVRDGTVSREKVDAAIEAHLRGEVVREERRKSRRTPVVEQIEETVETVLQKAVNQ